MAFTKVLPSGISTTSTLTVDSLDSVGAISATSITATTGTFSGNLNVAGVLTYEDVTNVDSIGIVTARSGLNVTGGSVGIGTDNAASKLTVYGTNQEDVIYISTGNNAGDTFANIRGDNESGIRIRGGGSYDGGTIELSGGLRDTDPGVIKFSTGTGISVDERLRITSDGNVGIGTDNPYANSGTNLHIHSANTTSEIRLTNSTTGGGLNGSIVQQGGNTLYISNSESGNTVFENAGSEKARITSTGNVQIANGNLVFSTSGTGIDFSATADGSGTTTSELLDDYEEGTFTPVLGGSTAGTTANGNGRYTKIGNTVFITIRFSNVTISGGSGQIKISGLPFTPNSASSNTPVANTQVYKVTMNTGVMYSFYASAGGLLGLVSRNGTTWADWDYSDWTATGIYANVSVTYDI